MVDRRHFEIEENIKKCFAAIDVDRNNKLTFKEVQRIAVFQELDSEDISFKKAFFKYSRGKYYITYDNFVSIVHAICKA